MNPLSLAVDQAPNAAGVYFFLGADTELLYVGKASSLRRRLGQHMRAKPSVGADRLNVLYRQVDDVRWHVLPDEGVAAAWEADIIVALRPVFNAAHTDQGRWNYIVVEPLERKGGVVRFTLAADAAAGAARSYGCFPHLGRGVSSRPAIACSDGYTAMLRLLWVASGTADTHFPSRITRAAPDAFDTALPDSVRAPLHAFLSGTSRRLLVDLAATEPERESYLAPGLARDREAAASFFLHGPRALRRLRLRHGRAPGPLSRERIEEFTAADVRDTIGEFRVPRPRDPTDDILTRRSHPWAKSHRLQAD
jgi:GIY-YIG catalytic domain